MNTSKLLLVDDNPGILKLNQAIFSSEGFETVIARDGKEAITILFNERIDLIVTDILMPNVDGYYLCFKVRDSELLRNIPIIIYSGTYTSESEEKTAKDMGADLFIRKPASSKILISAVIGLLKNPPSYTKGISASPESFEVMLQYSSSLIDKLEARNQELEEIKMKLEQMVLDRTMELKMANDDLNTANEELKTNNEELNSLNENLVAANLLIESRTNDLQEALEVKENLLKLKNAFVSMVSHEFRTPLSVISVSACFIKKFKTKINADVLDSKIDGIIKQVDNMAELFNNILTIGKEEAIRVVKNKINITIFKNLAQEVIEGARAEHELVFSSTCTIDFFDSDEGLIRNIVINLVSNAIKFSPEAKQIKMAIENDDHNLSLTIADDGIGIPPEDIKNLFISFSRAGNTGGIRGTGLGLSIVKKAVELLNGTIRLNSELGKGSEFKIQLPLNSSATNGMMPHQ